MNPPFDFVLDTSSPLVSVPLPIAGADGLEPWSRLRAPKPSIAWNFPGVAGNGPVGGARGPGPPVMPTRIHFISWGFL